MKYALAPAPTYNDPNMRLIVRDDGKSILGYALRTDFAEENCELLNASGIELEAYPAFDPLKSYDVADRRNSGIIHKKNSDIIDGLKAVRDGEKSRLRAQEVHARRKNTMLKCVVRKNPEGKIFSVDFNVGGERSFRINDGVIQAYFEVSGKEPPTLTLNIQCNAEFITEE